MQHYRISLSRTALENVQIDAFEDPLEDVREASIVIIDDRFERWPRQVRTTRTIIITFRNFILALFAALERRASEARNSCFSLAIVVTAFSQNLLIFSQKNVVFSMYTAKLKSAFLSWVTSQKMRGLCYLKMISSKN